MLEPNPYETPKADSPADQESHRYFAAYLMPRNTTDVLLATGFGLAIGGPLAGIAAAASYFTVGNPGVGAIAFGVMLVPLAFAGVKGLTLSSKGLRIHYYLTASKGVPWFAVEGVRQLTRWEYLKASFLAFRRFATSAIGFAGHYRIDYQRDYVLFPPKDAAEFLSELAKYAPQLVDQSHQPASVKAASL